MEDREPTLLRKVLLELRLFVSRHLTSSQPTYQKTRVMPQVIPSQDEEIGVISSLCVLIRIQRRDSQQSCCRRVDSTSHCYNINHVSSLFQGNGARVDHDTSMYNNIPEIIED
jgi:hypothetical protein